MFVVTTHQQADFDGLASMVAARRLYPDARLVFSGGAQAQVRDYLSAHDPGLTRLKDLELAEVTGLVLVDTQDPERIGPLRAVLDRPGVEVHVYDHHPADEPTPSIPNAHMVVAPVGATVTLLIEALEAKGVTPTPEEATLLALGLHEETGSFTYRGTTARDLRAAAWALEAGADLPVVRETLQSRLDPELIALLNDLLLSADTYYVEGRKVLLAGSTYDRYRGDLAEAVHRLAEIEGLDAVLAALAMDDKVQVIGRSRCPEIDVADLARAFGGGGHAAAAAATVKGQTVVEVKERLASLLASRSRPRLLARDVMTTPVFSVGATASIAEVERVLTTAQINVLPVLGPRGRYLGLISRETVQKALFHNLGETEVRQVMQVDAETATPDTPFRDIEATMVERNQRFVPILGPEPDAGTVVGVITRTDLLRVLHQDVLAAGRVRAKGEPLPASPASRKLRARLEERLPAPVVARLARIGQLAEAQGVSAYVVGGFVRDLLLGRPNLDVDVVIEGDGIAFARALARDAGGRATVHARFGTAVVVMPDGFKIDVATARTEYYEYPTALPTVAQSSIKKDLYRRDFTINALAIRLNVGRFGELLDFYGGQRDLKEGSIRVLHSLSFVEDPTRVFRAVRFEQRFGFRLGRETLALVKGAVTMELFHRLSPARLSQELRLLLSEPEPSKSLARLGELGLLKFVHRRLTWTPALGRLLKAVEGALSWYRLLYLDRPMEPWLVRGMALMDGLPAKAVGELLRRLEIPARQADKVRTARYRAKSILERLTKRTAMRPSEVVRLLEGLPDEVLVFLIAKAQREPVERVLSAYLTTYRTVAPQLTGRDLKALGIPPGPRYRSLLDRLRAAKLDGRVRTQEEERALVRKWSAGTASGT